MPIVLCNKYNSSILNLGGGVILMISYLVRLSFIHLEPEFFVFFDRTTDQLRWSFNAPRMPAVATMSGICGRLCWTCGSERARKAEIEVLCHPRTDHFSRSLKGSRLYAREVTINDARGQETPINHRSMELEVEGSEIDAREPGVFTSPPVEDRRSKQDQVKLVHQQRSGASTLH